MNKIIIFSILAVILLSVSFTSISALSPENEQKLNDKIKSLEKKIKELFAENTKLKNENTKLKNDIVKLKTENSQSKTTQKSNSDIKAEQGFSGLVCKKDAIGFVQITGKYTNDGKSHSFVFITLAIIGENGEVLDTGIGAISNIEPYQTKIFTASSNYSGNFKSCEVEVNLVN